MLFNGLKFASLMLACTLVLTSANPPAAGSISIEETATYVTVANGAITARFVKDRGEINSLKLGSLELMNNTGELYFDLNTESGYHSITGADYRVVYNDANRAEVAFRRTVDSEIGFTIDIHYVFEPNQPGLYCYVVLESQVGPALKLEQCRVVVRLDPEMFHYAAVSDDRQGSLPSVHDLIDAEEIADATYRLLDGTIVSKYFWSVYEGDPDEVYHRLHGLCGDNVGVWIISAGSEYLPGGPTRQNLTVQQSTRTPLAMKMLHAGHYLTSESILLFNNETWQKLYGPFFVYINTGADTAQMWTNAKNRVSVEVSAWPYAWMQHALYPLDRGTVRGQLTITDGSSPEGAWVILATPEPDWQIQGKDYIFWTRSDSNGFFSIPHVRPGSYTLYSIVSGVLDEYHLDEITVQVNAITDLGLKQA